MINSSGFVRWKGYHFSKLREILGMNKNKLCLIGCASGVAGADVHSGDGPLVMQQSSLVPYRWEAMLVPADIKAMSVDQLVGDVCQRLAQKTTELIRQKQWVSVIGGDHTCAVGTWSGAYDALHEQGDVGLIWFDAHMDSHTPDTTESGHIHGMPLAALLGHGYSSLTTIMHATPKLKPENVCLIGVRSYERGEADFLKEQNVRIYFMDEIKQRGFATVWREAIEHVSRHTIAYGLSIDIDGLDPLEAPGVDVPEPDGVHAEELYAALTETINDPRLIATEIVEFDPTRDREQLTEKIVANLLHIIAGRK
jgi:arginase